MVGSRLVTTTTSTRSPAGSCPTTPAIHDPPPRTWGLTSTAASYHHDLTVEESLSAATLNARLLAQTHLARVLNVIWREPSFRQSRPIVTGQILSPAELEEICQQAAKHSSNAHILVSVLAATGLKPSEVTEFSTASMNGLMIRR